MVEESEVTVARRAEVVMAEEPAEEASEEPAAEADEELETAEPPVVVAKVVAVPDVADARAAEQYPEP